MLGKETFMSIFDRQQIKQTILDFASSGVQTFRQNNPGLVFNAFAFDCNAEYAEINLCFNTEEAFEKTLTSYQKGEFAEYYQSDEDIEDLKFNTGDWDYQCFDSIHLLSDQELTKIFNQLPEDNYVSWNQFLQELMEIFCEALLVFSQTDVYKSIPKTEDFRVICIDHDEDVSDAQDRLESVKEKVQKK